MPLSIPFLLLFCSLAVSGTSAFLVLPLSSRLPSSSARHVRQIVTSSPPCTSVAATVATTDTSGEWDVETDVVVIGSGIGGLSCAALLAYYGEDVRVYESHYHAGGCAHGFEIDGFHFDSGPSLWNGMGCKEKGKRNPLGDILSVVGEGDTVKYAKYKGWGMYVPEGNFVFEVGPTAFEKVVREFGGGEAAVEEWRAFLTSLGTLTKISTAMTPLALRADIGAIFTVGRFLPSLARAGFSPAVTGPILDVAKKTLKNPFLINWIEFLSFAISGLPADSTIAAAMAYTLRDLHMEGAELDYPVGGSAAVVDALIHAINKHAQTKHPQPAETAERITLSAHVEKIILENGRAVGIQLRKGIDATGLPADLECHHTVINTWDKIDAPQNMAIISIPTTLDPGLAPPGHHVLHCYAAANEPYEPWEGLKPNSPEYLALKKERAEWLWRAVERVIPDVRQRVKVEMVASPLTHERFLRRSRGTYGAGWRAGKESFPGPKNINVKGLYSCGDSTFPGIGVPAVAASGANAANTIVPFWKHYGMLTQLINE
ncbi:hypothetical protein VYU27_001911 [Nannochloropsis oceanica]